MLHMFTGLGQWFVTLPYPTAVLTDPTKTVNEGQSNTVPLVNDSPVQLKLFHTVPISVNTVWQNLQQH